MKTQVPILHSTLKKWKRCLDNLEWKYLTNFMPTCTYYDRSIPSSTAGLNLYDLLSRLWKVELLQSWCEFAILDVEQASSNTRRQQQQWIHDLQNICSCNYQLWSVWMNPAPYFGHSWPPLISTALGPSHMLMSLSISLPFLSLPSKSMSRSLSPNC